MTSNIFDDELEAKGLGKCANCGTILPIERGENFVWIEEKSAWYCVACADDDTLPENKVIITDEFCPAQHFAKVEDLKVGEGIESSDLTGNHLIQRLA
jgi:hypothetical protein